MNRPVWWVGVLVLANLIYFTWTQGGLAVFGAVPAAFAEHEPQRLTRQIRPDALRIRPDTAAEPAPAPALPAAPPSPAEATPVDAEAR
ncbi:MAG: hypothetical protein EOP80_12935 [Variovorax sp.]|nr:MAG: hypothetical protein EOP80_12935 [Variovorax sp.]